MRGGRDATLRVEFALALHETSLRFATHGLVAALLVAAALFSAR